MSLARSLAPLSLCVVSVWCSCAAATVVCRVAVVGYKNFFPTSSAVFVPFAVARIVFRCVLCMHICVKTDRKIFYYDVYSRVFMRRNTRKKPYTLTQ